MFDKLYEFWEGFVAFWAENWELFVVVELGVLLIIFILGELTK